MNTGGRGTLAIACTTVGLVFGLVLGMNLDAPATVPGLAEAQTPHRVGEQENPQREPDVTRGNAPAAPVIDHMIIDGTELVELPTSGPAWEALLAVADEEWEEPDLANQDHDTAARVLAAALVHARTGEPTYADKVVGALEQVSTAPLEDATVLSVGRQLAGYVIAADLVGYRDPAFVRFVDQARTRNIGDHGRWFSLTQTSENTASNWGAWALASRIAASLYVGDETDLAKSAEIFRGFTGDRRAYDGFQHTDDFDPSWVCGNLSQWVPVNPASCEERSGALAEDISRSSGSYPEVDRSGLTYSWETLGGAALSARLLAHASYPDVYEWGDDALLRAAEFLQREGGYPPFYAANAYIPWSINRAYGADLGPVKPAGHGRQFGFTDWLP